MRIALITESGGMDAPRVLDGWCERLVHGMQGHVFDVYCVSDAPCRAGQALPEHVRRVYARPHAGPPQVGPPRGRRRRAYRRCHAELVQALTAPDGAGESLADRFAAGLYGLAELAREDGALDAYLRSDDALRTLDTACRVPGALPSGTRPDLRALLASAALLAQALRPLSWPWYGDALGGSPAQALAAADVCHAASGGPAALPGLLAGHFFGTPLLVTEYGVRLRDGYAAGGTPLCGAAARALMSAFHRLLARETYRRAALVTAGHAHGRRWQERCGADRDRLRTVYPGVDARLLPAAPEEPEAPTLVWTGRVAPEQDLVLLVRAFAEVRRQVPEARLRIVAETPQLPRAATGSGASSGPYADRCRALAGHLVPGRGPGSGDCNGDGDGDGEALPVSFEQAQLPGTAGRREAYASASVVVSSSAVGGFPHTLVEAMLSGRATVSTDVGAVREVIGGTGLVVPPGDPEALARACVALLTNRPRRDRLGAAARARALELFTAEQSVAAFRDIYLDLVAHCPAQAAVSVTGGARRPFACPAEAIVPGSWAMAGQVGARRSARWLPGARAPMHRPRTGAARVPTWARAAHGERAQGERAHGTPGSAATAVPGTAEGVRP